MKLRGHESFTLRQSWLRKVIVAVEENGAVFKQPPLNLGATFGVGVNMVKSMRYWGEVTNIISTRITPPPHNYAELRQNLHHRDVENESGVATKLAQREYSLSAYGREVLETDPHFENRDTWEHIHFNIIHNSQRAPIFHFFFNVFDLSEFTRNDVELAYRSFLEKEGVQAPDRSVRDDVAVLFNSYINDGVANMNNTGINCGEQIDFENISNCPLFVLKAITLTNSKRKVYRKSPNLEVSNQLLVKLLENEYQRESEVEFSEVAKLFSCFNFDRLYLVSRLDELDRSGKLTYSRTAGLDVIRLNGFDEQKASNTKGQTKRNTQIGGGFKR